MLGTDDTPNPTKEDGPGKDIEWDRVEDLTEDRKVGLYAGFWYLLDDDENAVSNGYHTLEKERHGYRARIGRETDYLEPHD